MKRGGGVTWKGAIVRLISFNAVEFLYLFLENVFKIRKKCSMASRSIEPVFSEFCTHSWCLISKKVQR